MVKEKLVVYPVIFVLGSTLILTSALVLLDQVTIPAAEFNQDIELKHKILNVSDILPKNTLPSNIDRAFKDDATEEGYKGNKLYTLKQDGEERTYAIPVSSPGLQGSVNGYAGIARDMKKLVGIEFIKQDETPDSDGRIAENEYGSQYKGLDVSKLIDGEAIVNKPVNGGNVGAISGAI